MIDPKQIWSSSQLPTLPVVAIRLLELFERGDVQVKEVVDVLRSDPAMCARILKATNSSFFGLRSKVTSIDRAVPLIGTTVVTSLALSFSLAEETMQSGAIAKHYFTYWRQSIVQASAAELLCRGKAKSKKNEYFLAGLLTDLGRLAMLKTVPQEYLPVLARSISEQSELRLLEAEMLGVDHVEIGTKLMDEWGLPVRLIKSVSCHHLSPDRLADEQAHPDFDLVQAVAIASSVGEFFCSPAKGPELQRLLELTQRFAGFSAADLDDFLNDVRDRTDEAGELLAANTSEIGRPAELMAQANEHLAHMALKERLEGTHTARKQEETERENSDLRQKNEQLEQDPLHDPLTLLYNRQFLEESLKNELVRSSRVATTVGVILCDIDRFGQINETHNRQFGDEVLKQFSAILAGVLRGSDVAARYGDDCFMILIPEPTEKGLARVAERIRAQIEAHEFLCDQTRIPVTASIGTALAAPARNPGNLHEELCAAAGQALDESKRHGRNQIHFQSLIGQEERRLRQEVRQRRFSRWLVSHRLLDVPTISKALLALPAGRQKLGTLAQQQGFVTTAQVDEILHKQRESGERFGEIARSLGYLTGEQLAGLLAVQLEDPLSLAKTLLSLELLDQNAVADALRKYLDEIGLPGNVDAGLTAACV